LTGIGFTVLNLSFLAFMVDVLVVPYLLACIVSFFSLNFFSYLANKRFSFRLGKEIIPNEIWRYYLVMLVSLSTNLVVMYFLVDIFSIHYLIASLFTSILLVVINFIAHAAISFQTSINDHQIDYDMLMVSAFHASHGGGIEAVAGKIVEQLASDGMKVSWISGHNGKTIVSKIQSGVDITICHQIDFIEPRFGLPLPIWTPHSLWVLWKSISKANIIHLHDYLYIPCIAAMLFSRLQRKPVVLTQHIGELPLSSIRIRNLITLLNRTLGRWMLGSAQQTVFIAQPVMDFFSTVIPFSRPPKLIPNGVDHTLYRPDPKRKIQPERQLLFVGRFVEKKGIHLLKQCLDIKNVHWTFVGWGPLSPKKWSELPSNFTIIEHAAPEDIVPLYQKADLLILPSVGEGFPLVIQEALSCGTPVLTSIVVADTCPNRDKNCVFDVDISALDPVIKLRTRITDLITDSNKLQRARQHAVMLAKQWSWENCAAEYRKIYSNQI